MIRDQKTNRAEMCEGVGIGVCMCVWGACDDSLLIVETCLLCATGWQAVLGRVIVCVCLLLEDISFTEKTGGHDLWPLTGIAPLTAASVRANESSV